VEFRILGPLEVRQAGQLVPVTATKQRALLAIGLAQANRVVSVSRLIDAIWGDAPPASASGLIHTYVSALRRMLQACGGGDVIATRPPGYLVQVRPDQLDLLQFEDFLAEGRAAAAAGGHTAAATAMRAALACWRGPALDGVDSPVVRAEAARLDELRFVALEECITAELAGGDARSLVAELVGAVS
jgi:DNA-binding SARP family transcriptional activator